ncbi:preprotein translocase subunit SecG [Erythrobacter sp. JK5]|uniref:preprotein translocase subunit SecG n=1 Tax=Erythrobacter sp. JK5 TaxID=2829500 RepID=UPI001BAC4C4A|nr:preprotein translocase subunit SecG [Erythrobacter sp. JK5]QUL38660.1 preprotein translocase subunit SecG [Erythrobacter sp. JK5]
MSFFLFLTVIQTIVAAALVGVVLMQRSEGGGLGIGGSPGGALGARGAADFLTRATKWLAVAFVGLSIALAAVAVDTTSADEITSTLDRGGPPAGGAADLLGEPEVPAAPDPLADPAAPATPEAQPTGDVDPLAE